MNAIDRAMVQNDLGADLRCVTKLKRTISDYAFEVRRVMNSFEGQIP